MSNLDDDIEKAIKDFNYYLRNRQKWLNNPKKFEYYHERVIRREENLQELLQKKVARDKSEG